MNRETQLDDGKDHPAVLQELERHGGHSYATVAERLRVSRAMVCALLRRLPSDSVPWLEQEDDRTNPSFRRIAC